MPAWGKVHGEAGDTTCMSRERCRRASSAVDAPLGRRLYIDGEDRDPGPGLWPALVGVQLDSVVDDVDVDVDVDTVSTRRGEMHSTASTTSRYGYEVSPRRLRHCWSSGCSVGWMEGEGGVVILVRVVVATDGGVGITETEPAPVTSLLRRPAEPVHVPPLAVRIPYSSFRICRISSVLGQSSASGNQQKRPRKNNSHCYFVHVVSTCMFVSTDMT
ncbi:hypothetical protein P171DRAFT_156806 [Karstenula rhodostoma CBS 690.94]|uniref:Uncharacterized protein n=1 Tax=Karstenula rhodostoma CBS 690.94 TaxID=1392251 RepID=A0A9P4U6I4_9PLEO|nr:hypothetical protein P171DRAFT_156806 [Karstenula rhodostoma CBS 690.94]